MAITFGDYDNDGFSVTITILLRLQSLPLAWFPALLAFTMAFYTC